MYSELHAIFNSMESRLTHRQIDDLQQAIFYLKMSELRDLAHTLGLSALGQKRDLITGIMNHVQGTAGAPRTSAPRVRSGKQVYTLDAPLYPGTYTNGAAARRFLQQKIGSHFRFTTFGMDWIKRQWATGLVPTFRQFIRFWEQEYNDRRNGKSFVSKPELARVNFYRRMAERGGYQKSQLEALWKQTRLHHVGIVRSIFPNWR